MIKKATFILATQLLFTSLYGQVVAELYVENQLVSGTDFFFDIYLRRTAANPGSGDLYLGHTDFILTFDAACFADPVLSKYPAASPGNCLLVPTDASGPNTAATRDYYYTNLSTGISGNELFINLNGPSPADQAAFDAGVARVDQTAGTHRLGTFKISGLVNPSCSPALGWKLYGDGISTRIFSFGNTATWVSSPALPEVGNCTPNLTVMSAPIPAGTYRSLGDLTSTNSTVANGTVVTFMSDTGVLLGQQFTVELGGVFVVVLQECMP